MPKMKTKRAAAKRFKVTGTGKIKRFKAYKRHILTKKSTKRKRDLRQSTILDETNVEHEEGHALSLISDSRDSYSDRQDRHKAVLFGSGWRIRRSG